MKFKGRKIVYSETGEEGSVQEALFHFFGLPLEVIAQHVGWYARHRTPRIREVSKDRQRVLVDFTAESLSGTFGGSCLYACDDEEWGAYTIRPNKSDTIATAEAWLIKRKWQPWK